MTDEIKKLLMDKFIQFGAKLGISSFDGANTDIVNSETFKTEIDNRLGTGLSCYSYSSQKLNGCPFGIATIVFEIEKYIDVKIVYTNPNKYSKLLNSVTIYDINADVKVDTSNLVGKTKILMDNEIERQKKLGKFDTKSEKVKKKSMNIFCLDDINKNGKYESMRNIRVSVTQNVYIIFYKELFAFITEEELKKLFIDRETESNKEIFKELEVLTIEDINEKNEKEKSKDEIKEYIKSKISDLEYRLSGRSSGGSVF